MLGKGVRGERKPKLETPERVPFAGFRPVEHAVTSPFLDVPIPAYDDAQPLTNEVLAPTSADGLHTPSGISSWAAQPNWSVAQTDLLTRAALQSPLVSEARRVDPHEGSSGASSTMQTASSLGSSLLITASIGFILQIFASNLLGPEETGRVGTAEGIAAICLGLLSLGFDTYVRREVSIRPSHAKEFVPGAILLRAVLSVPVAIFIALLLPVFGKPAKVVAIFVVFALAKFVMQTNEMLAACLHAVGRVKGIAKQNLIAKLFGGVTLLGLIAADRGGISLPISLLVGETVKLVYLAKRTGVELGVWSRIGNQEIRPELKRSVPFISTVLITSFTMFLDVTLLGFLVSAKEVGFYRFGQQLVMIAYSWERSSRGWSSHLPHAQRPNPEPPSKG